MIEQHPLPGCDTEPFTILKYTTWSNWRNGERDTELQGFADFYLNNPETVIFALKALSDIERAAALFVLAGIAPQSVAEVLALLAPPDSLDPF